MSDTRETIKYISSLSAPPLICIYISSSWRNQPCCYIAVGSKRTGKASSNRYLTYIRIYITQTTRNTCTNKEQSKIYEKIVQHLHLLLVISSYSTILSQSKNVGKCNSKTLFLSFFLHSSNRKITKRKKEGEFDTRENAILSLTVSFSNQW